jgi:hypothetical protein
MSFGGHIDGAGTNWWHWEPELENLVTLSLESLNYDYGIPDIKHQFFASGFHPEIQLASFV